MPEGLKKHYSTIIIGGGMAGCGAARTLTAAGYEDFLMITPEIGGRIVTSEDGQVNYGAYFVSGDYDNVNQFVKKTR